MKTLTISDETCRKLTAALGMLMVETVKLQAYNSTITALLTRSVKLPKEAIMNYGSWKFIKRANIQAMFHEKKSSTRPVIF